MSNDIGLRVEHCYKIIYNKQGDYFRVVWSRRFFLVDDRGTLHATNDMFDVYHYVICRSVASQGHGALAELSQQERAVFAFLSLNDCERVREDCEIMLNEYVDAYGAPVGESVEIFFNDMELAEFDTEIEAIPG